MKTTKKILLLFIGSLSLTLGILGIFLPILPTTPFILLSGSCYLKSSNKLYNWLINHKFLGIYIINFKEGKGVPIKAKFTAILFIWLSFLTSALLFIKIIYLKIIFILLAIFFTILVLRTNTLKS